MSDNKIDVYISRGNVTIFLLKQDGQEVVGGAVTRAIFRFGEYCIDTDNPHHPISLIDNSKAVRMQLGLVNNLQIGRAIGRLTIYDTVVTEGIAWGESVKINIQEWKTCS